MRFFSQRGLLLVEAVLCVVVIAVGLVFIERGLGSQLQALRAVTAYETLTGLAHDKLLELEVKRRADRLQPQDRRGTFEAPAAAYQWHLSMTLRNDLADENHQPLAGDVLLTVERADRRDRVSPALQLRAVWPVDNIPPEWFVASGG